MIWHLTLIILSGILLGFSFPNFNFWFFAYFFLLPLFYLANKKNYLTTFISGFFSGVLGYSITLYWIYPTVYENTSSVFQSALSLFLISGYLSLYLAAYLIAHKYCLSKTPLADVVILCAASSSVWIALEFARCRLFTGFPWAMLGYSQWNFLPIVQLSEYTGVYGVSFFIVFFNLTVFGIIKKRGGAAYFNFLPIILLLAFGGVKIASYRSDSKSSLEKKIKGSLNLAVIQPNIDQYKKWNPVYQSETLKKIESQILSVSSRKPDLILWPETSIVENPMSPWLRKTIQNSESFNVVGTFWENGGKIYNSAVMFDPKGDIINIHRKTHLVPFGEYVPFRSILERYFDVFNYMGDLNRGDKNTVMSLGDVDFSVVICSENFFGHKVRKFVKNGAGMVMVISNNAWFGKTSAAFHHFTFNVFRAVETRRFFVQSDNIGISGIVSSEGKILHRTSDWKDDFFVEEVHAKSGNTFYVNYGDVFAICCILFSFGVIFLPGKMEGVCCRNLNKE